MNCPPHVADAFLTTPQGYRVVISKEDVLGDEIRTEVDHLEKQCKICKLPIIILTEKLNQIIARDGWEIEVEIIGP